jgi:hypothetical protein
MNILIENKDLKLTLNNYGLIVYINNIQKIEIQLFNINNKLEYEYSNYSDKIFHIIFLNSLFNCNNNLREFIFDYFDNLEYELFLKKRSKKNG